MPCRWLVAFSFAFLVCSLSAEEQKPALVAPASDQKPPPLEKKPEAPADKKPEPGKDVKAPDKPADKAKTFDELMRDALAVARKNLKSAAETVLAQHKEMTPELRAQMLSSTQHDRWIDQSRSGARDQAKMMNKLGNDKVAGALGGNNWSDPTNPDVKGLTLPQKLEYDAVASWTEQKSISWLEETMSKYDEDRKARIAAAEKAKKGKKGGENTAPPNGGLIDTPLGPLTH